MPRVYTGRDVFAEAVHRMVRVYGEGHRVVVSFSGGKDSGVCLEVCLEAARQTGRLPVEVIMRDEEIMFPGTFEYAERVAARPEVRFHWIYACQPIINCFNRASPYWWVFDPLVPPEKWVRRPPAFAYRIPEMDIGRMTTPARFPPDPGRDLFAVIGLRVVESRGRRYGVHSSGGYLTKPNAHGTRNCRPIYDWEDGDVWRAIHVNGWDFNTAYNTLHRLGAPAKFLRIAPPTMAVAGVPNLQLAARAWPLWFERVCNRLEGVRAAANYGIRAVKPQRRLSETWEDCFQRVCIDEAPAWIAARAGRAREEILHRHAQHASTPLPEIQPCYTCYSNIGCWKKLAEIFYTGDPFGMRYKFSRQEDVYVEPEFFRPGSGKWGGSPAFA